MAGESESTKRQTFTKAKNVESLEAPSIVKSGNQAQLKVLSAVYARYLQIGADITRKNKRVTVRNGNPQFWNLYVYLQFWNLYV